MKFNLENQIILFMSECGRIFEKCFKTTDLITFKKEKLKDKRFDVAQTRMCAVCGLDEEMRWLALHPLFSTEANRD